MENNISVEIKSLADKARKILAESTCTFVACSENNTLKSTARGVKPLLDMLDSSISLENYAVADKVVGKAAAYLYFLLGAQDIYAAIISTPALEVFSRFGIKCTFGVEVPVIKNRTDTGLCPMESTVLGIDEPVTAEKAIREKLSQLNIG